MGKKKFVKLIFLNFDFMKKVLLYYPHNTTLPSQNFCRLLRKKNSTRKDDGIFHKNQVFFQKKIREIAINFMKKQQLSLSYYSFLVIYFLYLDLKKNFLTFFCNFKFQQLYIHTRKAKKRL